MNKLNRFTSIKVDECPQRPQPPLFPTEDFAVHFNTWDVFPQSPTTGPSDEAALHTAEKNSGTGTTAPKKKTSTRVLAHPLESNDGTTNY